MINLQVAMVIFTMHAKSSDNLHNAQIFEKKMLESSVTYISCNHNDEIAKLSSIWIS